MCPHKFDFSHRVINVWLNVYSPEEFKNPSFVGELEQDIASECSKLGPLEKITVFEKNPRGVVIVKFGTAYAASECLRVFNGRFFGGTSLDLPLKCSIILTHIIGI